jgi:hypothetical protein
LFSCNGYKMLIEYSKFTDCYRSCSGSCLLISGSDTNFIFARSFSLRNYITTSDYGIFIYSSISSSYPNNFNFVLFSSIANSGKQNVDSCAVVKLDYGLIRMISTNYSNNIAYHRSIDLYNT